MNSSDQPDQRDETEEERETPVLDETSGESGDFRDNSIEDSNVFLNEVEENWSRSQIEVETRSSGVLEAPDSGEHVECERENHPDTALADNSNGEQEDDKVLKTIETVQDEAQESPSHQLENAEKPLELFGVELLEEAVKEYGNFSLETEVRDEDILEMNIKVGEAIDNNFTGENETTFVLTGVRKESYPEYDEPIDKNESDEPEYFLNHSKNKPEELLDFIEMEEPSADSVMEALVINAHVESNLEIAIKMEETTDEQGLAVRFDIIGTETTNESVTEVYNRNAETVRENEEVLEMNIKVEESTTKHIEFEKEIQLTLVCIDQEKKGNYGSLNSNESAGEIIDVQDVPPIELEKKEETSEFDPVKEPATEFDIVDVQGGIKNLGDVKEEDMTTQEKRMSETNQEETKANESGTIISVAFIPKTLDEPIEFIDSETLEVIQNKNEHPTEMSEELGEKASLPLNEENLIADGKQPTQLEELTVELVPVVPPRPLQEASSTQEAAGSKDNVELYGASADSIKSPEKVSGGRKPEWIRKSLVRKGSVRRLFSRMKSKRFNHDRLLATPPPQPTAPHRPLRQIIVDFLLLLFES